MIVLYVRGDRRATNDQNGVDQGGDDERHGILDTVFGDQSIPMLGWCVLQDEQGRD